MKCEDHCCAVSVYLQQALFPGVSGISLLGSCVCFRLWKSSLFWARQPEHFQGFIFSYFLLLSIKTTTNSKSEPWIQEISCLCGRMSYEFLPKVSSCTSPCKPARFCASPAAPVQPHQLLCTHQLACSLLRVCANTRIIADALQPSVCLSSHVLMLIGPGKM